jgi:alpha-ribazole phosphatase
MAAEQARLCIIRHAEIIQARGICYGHTDWVLTAEELNAAANAVRDQLPEWPMYSSPLKRCADMAKLITTRDVALDDRLREMSFGDWEGKPWSDIPRYALDVWSADVAGFRMPGGESFNDLLARTDEFLRHLTQPCVVIAHAGTVKACSVLMKGKSIKQAAQMKVPHLTPIYF